MNTLAKAWAEVFSSALERSPAESRKQSRTIVEALALLAEVREAVLALGRPDLVRALDEIYAAYVAGDPSSVTERLREIKGALTSSRHEMPRRTLAEQEAALARVRAGSKPFADYQSLDAPAIHEILEQETVSADEMAVLMNMKRQAIDQRRERGELLALQGSKRGYRYPRWQSEPRLWKTLPPVLTLLRNENPWDVFAFLEGRYPALGGRTPLDFLREGKTERVMDFAHDAFALERRP